MQVGPLQAEKRSMGVIRFLARQTVVSDKDTEALRKEDTNFRSLYALFLADGSADPIP